MFSSFRGDKKKPQAEPAAAAAEGAKPATLLVIQARHMPAVPSLLAGTSMALILANQLALGASGSGGVHVSRARGRGSAFAHRPCHVAPAAQADDYDWPEIFKGCTLDDGARGTRPP